MDFPIVLEHGRLLNQIHYLDSREKEARQTLVCIDAERKQLVESIRLSMASTGSKSLDFAIVACDGTHDEEVQQQYKNFEAELAFVASGAHRGPKTILIVQNAHHVFGNGSLGFMRCVHLATIAPQPVHYIPFNLLIDIPVIGSVYVRSEILNSFTGVITACDSISEKGWITAGPLRNKYCHTSRAKNESLDQKFEVPYGAGFKYTFYPCNRSRLDDMEVDVRLVTECMRNWTHLRAARAR